MGGTPRTSLLEPCLIKDTISCQPQALSRRSRGPLLQAPCVPAVLGTAASSCCSSCGLLSIPFFFFSLLQKYFSFVQSLSRVQLFVTPWTAAHQASLSITNSQSLLKLMSIKLVMPSNHLILCCPLFPLPSIFPSIRVFCNESVLHGRWPKLLNQFLILNSLC